MIYKDLIVEKRGRAVCVTLNRPERMNSISVETSSELLHVLTAYRDDPEQWVMILGAAGQKAFCSGMYVTEAACMSPRRLKKRRKKGAPRATRSSNHGLT
jgi:enoyl-CoA hydratase/carnithine racemase